MESYNIYCDESGHLQHEKNITMVLGAIRCPTDKSREIADALRQIKCKHRLSQSFEIKWTKVSPAQVAFYMDLVDFFFARDDLIFRAWVIPDKSKLRHDDFNQDHDTWYYKMYYQLLDKMINKDDIYRIFIDIKDTRSEIKRKTLHDILCRNIGDRFCNVPVFQQIRSHESQLMQLSDYFIGAVGYANRHNTNPTRLQIIDRIERLTCRKLTQKAPLSYKKFNIYIWDAQEV